MKVAKKKQHLAIVGENGAGECASHHWRIGGALAKRSYIVGMLAAELYYHPCGTVSAIICESQYYRCEKRKLSKRDGKTKISNNSMYCRSAAAQINNKAPQDRWHVWRDSEPPIGNVLRVSCGHHRNRRASCIAARKFYATKTGIERAK